ncbi:ChuX/HutX family heme-like substrate-binding protein [Fulvimarina sp. 2208YS6-2-32]|uniref:ChuX/HutX family heme-like substrate-binding protein n=1 Tax=Fulvimarina uroteuthidis TaxID=3098149 RepID=A0ABU5I7K4_9HYPH|nr:ChuX/HutX family heme-like substrate-binding protein [Fulvimarina sp. 2208YS6-2-32]MDY8110181.1 ChuX/HutX family heme-like substrate-binding protein [Fulvimarina sp. 2208YS6-2-32]
MSLNTAPARPAAPVPFYETGKRTRDLAHELGCSEAEILDRHAGPEVVRLRCEPADLVESLADLRQIMALTRNEAAVHEIVGTFANVSISGPMGLVLAPPLDLRLFLRFWVHAYAVEIPDGGNAPRRSLQIFDGAGEAVIKIHLRPVSDIAAFEALRDRFADKDPAPRIFTPHPPADGPSATVDAAAFRRDVAGMDDIHEFVPLLRKHGVDRRQSLDLMGAPDVRRLGAGAATAILTRAADDQVPIMCFVGNRGCIQIFTGHVATVKAMGPWINVLDQGFNLHLREDLVAEAFVVRKPTREGALTSVELYGADRALIAQFFGERERGRPERRAWQSLVEALPHV